MDEQHIEIFKQFDFSSLSNSLSKDQLYTIAYVFLSNLGTHNVFYFFEAENKNFNIDNVETHLFPTLAFKLICQQNFVLQEKIQKALPSGYNDKISIRPSNHGKGQMLIFAYNEACEYYKQKAFEIKTTLLEKERIETHLTHQENNKNNSIKI